MPTHPLLPFVESPDGLSQDHLISGSASMPGPGSSMTPHGTTSEKPASQAENGLPVSCMFCDQTFGHQEQLGPHVLAQHPTTLFEPSVLCVEAEFRIPGERAWPRQTSVALGKQEVLSCILCGHVSQDATELETHLRKHKDYFTYCCNVCGRRFREPWFLKKHMKMHGKIPGAKNKAQQDLETPITINDIIQEQQPQPVVTAYKMCMVCGFFFPDQDSLVEHSKAHNREAEPGKDKTKDNPDDKRESPVKQETFLECLKLKPRSDGDHLQPERSSRWIAQLDPFKTYQAWQLATKGKIAVGPNNTKDLGMDASTDNEDCNSDKEELGNIWTEGDKSMKEALGREVRTRQHMAAETPSPEPDQRPPVQKDKERPTTCEDCGRNFRTYHQLVLHSRVHKRERGGEESPTASIDGKLSAAGSLDHAEEGSEDGSEEAAVSETLASGECGFERSKVKSKECSYCGKTFRSNYYLTVHLRTHTGEKPYKCMYCDYAAAQKTSLKYHLDRRHKDKTGTELSSTPVPSAPSPNDKVSKNNNAKTPNRAKLWVPIAKLCTNGKPEGIFSSSGGKLSKPITQMNMAYEKLIGDPARSQSDDMHIKYPVPVNLKIERTEIKDEQSEEPLNLSLKVCLSLAASPEPQNASTPSCCTFCAFKTLYPEVLIMHKNLTHKDKSDVPKRGGARGCPKAKRFTGCPPALDGKDVAPLTDRKYPRRTKSPTRPAAKPQEKTASNPPPAPKRSPVRVPREELVPEVQRCGTKTDQHVNQDPPKFTELVKKSTNVRPVVIDKPAAAERAAAAAAAVAAAAAERSCPVRTGVVWHSDAAMLCLTNRFGSLPQLDLAEPSSKRLKYGVPPGREPDAAEKHGFRISAGEGSNRLLGLGRSLKTSSQGSSPPAVSEAPGPMRPPASAMGGNLDTDWNMINILRSYTPSDLASLYHGSPANPSHGGLANPRAGGRTTLYQHLPSLPNLQMRDHSGPFPSERFGTTDKSI